VTFVRKWMLLGHPTAYWLNGFFFPHGFMTGILQTYARKYNKAIDFLKFKFIINQEPVADPQQLNQPEDGVLIYGLYLESAQWDYKTMTLAEQDPGCMSSPMAVIHFLPFEVKHLITGQVKETSFGDESPGQINNQAAPMTELRPKQTDTPDQSVTAQAKSKKQQ